jgi:hypothetical protein
MDNDGASWDPPIRLSTGTGVPWTLDADWFDYNGVAGSPVDGKFLAAWADARAQVQDGARLWAGVPTPP